MNPKEFAEKYCSGDYVVRCQLVNFLSSGVDPEWAKEVYYILSQKNEACALSFLVDLPLKVCVEVCKRDQGLKQYFVEYLSDCVSHLDPLLTEKERMLLLVLGDGR
ncbi:MAG: hypothetical protein ACK4NC_07275 [Candidatus Gracilibacteria bacterium]